MRLVILTIILIATSCSKQERVQSNVPEEATSVAQAISNMRTATRRLDGKPCRRKVDWERFYQSVLKKRGVDDFSTQSLIQLMDSEKPGIRHFSALLLGHRKELSAIPRLEEALSDESAHVQRAATTALLKMGNRKGIPVLEEFCEKASKEFDQRDGQHDGELAVDLMDAAKVLADAGEVSAIPHLRKSLGYHRSWGIRLKAVRSLSKLYKKDAAVLTDIASMQDDEHPQVRREASEILQRIEANK